MSTRAKTSSVGLCWYVEVLTIVSLLARVVRAESNQCFSWCKKRRDISKQEEKKVEGRDVEEEEESRRQLSDEDAGLISFFFCSFLLSDCHWDGRVYASWLFSYCSCNDLTAYNSR